MCRRKFVWRQGTKYVVGLQKYWVTSKTVGSQHFPEALHVFQPSGLGWSFVAESKGGVFPRGFLHREKLFRGRSAENPLNSCRIIDYHVEQEVEQFVARSRPIRRTNAKCDSLLKICEVCTAMGRLIAPLSVSHCRYY